MDILYSDRALAVIVKPLGMDSEHAVPAAIAEALGGEVFPIHRLDLNVGGVMVYARTRQAAAQLSKLVQEGQLVKEYRALVHGIPAEGGLYMLVAQAVKASEIFTDTSYNGDTLRCVYRKIVSDKENIVLVGMPGCGKSTVGYLLSVALGRELKDTDKLIEKKAGKDIPAIFREDGEAVFRELEAEVIRECASENGAVIATGGGTVLRADNVDALRENGRIYFIDRPLELLMPTSDRPLSSTREDITQRYEERYGIYKAAADITVSADCSPGEVAEKIIEEFRK